MVRVSSGPTEDHEFYTLGPEGFELFARALHGAQPGIFNTSSYGTSGFKQYGADHIAYSQGAAGLEISVGQSKAYKEFEQDGIRKAVDAFVKHWNSHWKGKSVRRFILFVGCRIRKAKSTDEIIAQAQKLGALGVAFEVWDATEIYGRLAAAQHVVRLHLGLGWVEHLFGPAVNPIAAIVQDVARGDLGALSATMLVGQLNRAEAAQVADLRRRIRRGEVAAARRDIGQALAQPVVDALADDVRADLLRLSAALNTLHGDPDKAKAELDEADQLDDRGSARQRAMLCTETLGPEKTIEGYADTTDPDVAEVVASSYLRLGRNPEALAALAPGLAIAAPSAETLRLAALAHLLSGDRDAAVDHAKRSVDREAESRACRHLLALTLFARAVTPRFKVQPGDWPVPIDQPLILATDQARADLEDARGIIAALAADPELDHHREILAWSFAIHACIPTAKPSAEDMLTDLIAQDRLTGPIVAWSLARGLPLDLNLAARTIDRERDADREDAQLLLMAIAITSQRRERAAARALLDEGRATLLAKGLDTYVRYWSAVLDMDEGRTTVQAALDEWPWLALRAAMKIRYKAKRLKEVARLAGEAAKPDGDPRILFATIQILVDASHSGTAAQFTDALIEGIGTAEAVTLAVHVLARAGLHERALAALETKTAFPGGKLPDELERLRIQCNAALGRLVQAAQDLGQLAAITGSPSDLWTSIEWNLAVGEVRGARDLYLRHKHALAAPTASHLRLANAVMRTDPTLASDIARQLAAAAPDALVTATFDLASRLRLGTEQRRLMQRIQLLGTRGVAGVEIITDIAVVLERMEQARKQADQNYESYCNGHIAVQMLANLNESVFAQQYLGNLLAPPDASRRPAPVHARYGRRYDEAIWPERREDVSVIMDLTALLTVHGLGLLDIVERAFGRILLAPDAVNVLTHIRQKTTPLQPDRLEAARHLVELADQGALPDPATVSPVDTFRVIWEVADGEPESTLNLPALIAAMQAAWDAAQLADITDRLDETVKVAPVGPRPKAGATVILDAGIAVELHLAGALDAVRGHYTVCVTGEEIDQRRFEILQAERDERLAAALDTLIERIAAGAKDGTYEFVPFDPKAPAEPVSRQYFQCLRAMETQGSLFWVDDRFTTSVDTPAYPTVTTVEILEALGRYGRLDAGRITQARLHLRAAGWTFMPVDGPEIASLVLACVRGGEVSESEDLRTLRRSTAWSVLERRRLQWPSGEQADQGVRGEIPFLLDQGSAVVAALISIWSDKKVSNDDASAASSWILEHLDMSGRPPTVIPAGDPRSDFLAGLHIGHLVALAMQVTPLRRNADRKKAYLQWLWGDVIGNRLRSCPEMLPTVLETIERLLLEDVLEDPDQQRVWNAFSFEVVDALPDELRNRLLDRPAMTAAYNVQRTGTMAAAGGEFDARAYLATIIALQPGKDSRLKTVDGRKAKFRLTRNGEESAVTVTIGRRSAQVDDWPRRMSSDDAVVRRAALEEQAIALDMGPSERDALSDELAAISGAERPLKVVFLAGDTMSGWFGQLEGKLRARKPIGPAEILPDDIAPAFLRLQLDGTRSLVDAQARTIEAVGLYEAIRRWSGVPVAPSPAFFDAIAATSDDAIIELADRIAKGGTTWNKVFVARLLWDRGVENAALGQILGDALLDALTGERADGEWELLSACAQFLTGDLPQRPDWHDHPVADRLAMLWSHAGTLTQHFLAAGLTPTGLAEFLISNRLASPRLLVAEQTGFSGDVANPLDAFSRRLRIHAAAPLLAEMAKDGTKKETAMRAAFALLMHVVDDTPMFALRASHGELTHQDALSSYLAEPACEHLEPLFDHEIPYLAPRIGPFLSEMVTGDDPMTVRGAWIQLRSAMGHGRLPDALASPVRAAAAKAPIVTSPEAVISDLSVLLAVSAIAAANGWSDLADSIDDAFGQLLATGQSGDQITTLLFETAFNRAWLEEQSERRIEVLADRLEQLRSRPDMMEEAVTAAARFADAMSGTLAQPFIDLIARGRS